VLAVNPASLVKAKAEHNERTRFLSEAEEARLLSAIRKHWPEYVPAFLVSIHTGMRAGEQFQLKWRDVSFDRRIISLPRTKTGKARHIPLNAIALRELRQRKQAQEMFEEAQTSKGASHHELAQVFRDAGDPQHNYRRWFNEALTEAKINDYSWHCNRHTFASRLVMAGVDLRTVAELMGHSSIQMIMRYAHLAPQHNRAAVDRLVPVSETRRAVKGSAGAASREDELVTKAVTGRNLASRLRTQSQDKRININNL
jgi:integrase